MAPLVVIPVETVIVQKRIRRHVQDGHEAIRHDATNDTPCNRHGHRCVHKEPAKFEKNFQINKIKVLLKTFKRMTFK